MWQKWFNQGLFEILFNTILPPCTLKYSVHLLIRSQVTKFKKILQLTDNDNSGHWKHTYFILS